MKTFKELTIILDHTFRNSSIVFRDIYFRINGERSKDFRLFQIRKNEDNIFHLGVVISNPSLQEISFMPTEINKVLPDWKKIEIINSRLDNQEKFSSETLIFSGHFYLITDIFGLNALEQQDFFQKNGFRLIVEDDKLRSKMFKNRKPDFFLCHDSRDKESIARPLFEALIHRNMKVWFDEVELKIGDSLTERIEEGITNCGFGIIIISKNFLSNERWAKNELQSLKTRQIISNTKLILPIWHEIEEDDLPKYSYWLIDKVAGKSSEGIESLASKLVSLIDNNVS